MKCIYAALFQVHTFPPDNPCEVCFWTWQGWGFLCSIPDSFATAVWRINVFVNRIITNAVVGIIVCVGLVLTFLHANSVLRQQVVLCIIFKVAICNLLQGCKTSETQLGSAPGNLCQHGGSSLKMNFHKFETLTGPRLPVARSYTTFFLTISWSSGINCGID